MFGKRASISPLLPQFSSLMPAFPPIMNSQGSWVFSSPTFQTWTNLFHSPKQTMSVPTTPSNSQAYVTTPDTVGDNVRSLDSGATYHLRHFTTSTSESTLYSGPGMVHVGNGVALPIIRTGQSSLLTYSRPLYM
ncbi:hypothetical protein PVK06_008956 [Gossypium arboreum]|uniref:Uncharacterized protein n=1 Tax=Gossypium arboreum TaxID=29729 RepID=A0ABR0QL87_GOSAR|nr:hypothetical protein PVK06_008956 [Gossypium arboreum]